MSMPSDRRPLRAARRAWILEELQHRGVLRISELTESLGAAAVTIRRDIAELAADGLVRRVRGGVTRPENPVTAGDSAAANGTTGGERSLGMLVPSLDYYWPEVAHGAEEAARELDMRLVLSGSSYDVEDEQPQLARLVDRLRVDALIIAPSMDAPTAGHTIEWLEATGLPVVLLERTATAGPHHAALESVVSDHALGAAMAVRHLVSLGHRRIGAVLPEHSPTAPHVRRGWLEAAAECGLDTGAAIDAIAPGIRSPDQGAALDDILNRCLATGTTALIVNPDSEAIALVERCENRHIAVPGDLSVVSYDDEFAGLSSPPLTAVHPHRRSIGRAAVRLVADRLADPERPAHRITISPSLRLRHSTAPPPSRQ